MPRSMELLINGCRVDAILIRILPLIALFFHRELQIVFYSANASRFAESKPTLYDVAVNAVMRFRLRTSHKICIYALNRWLRLQSNADSHEKRKKLQKGFARLSGLLVRLCVFCGDPSTASTASKRQSVRSPVIAMHKNPQLQPSPAVHRVSFASCGQSGKITSKPATSKLNQARCISNSTLYRCLISDLLHAY